MKLDTRGTKRSRGSIDTLAKYLENINDLQLWDYMGLTVEIDPTVDYDAQNVLVRWTDIHEGFNDRLIVYSLKEFEEHFTIIKND